MSSLDRGLDSPESENIGGKNDAMSVRSLGEIRDRWARTVNSLSDKRFCQFYIACPQEELSAIILYLNEKFQAVILENVELDLATPASTLIDYLRGEIGRINGSENDRFLVTTTGFEKGFEFWYRKNARPERYGHDFNQELAENNRSREPLSLGNSKKIIVIVHINYSLPQASPDEVRVIRGAIGSAAASRFSDGIIKVDPPPELRPLIPTGGPI